MGSKVQKLRNEQAGTQHRLFAHQQDPAGSYEQLFRTAPFEVHGALLSDGAAVSHTRSTEQLHFKMSEGLQDLAFPPV